MDNISSELNINLQWYPGHMTKTRRMMDDEIKKVDIVIELTDARIPESSRNPDIIKLTLGKPRLLLINKCDMADPVANAMWLKSYKDNFENAILIDSISGYGFKNIIPAIYEILADKLERMKAKGIINQPVRAMIVGIPNVGKSSFINKFAGSKRAKVEDRPGVTRGKQWISVEGGIDLLDTPGILWPKFENPTVAENLAFTGAIKDDIMDIELVSIKLLERLKATYSKNLYDRYKLDDISNLNGLQILEMICKKRGFVMRGSEFDYERAAKNLLVEFRTLLLGRITLEWVE